MADRLTAKTLPAYRKATLAAQDGRCALCGFPVTDDEAVTDHDHTTGVIRGVLHRGCNAMLGHIENNRARHKLTNVARLSAFMTRTVEYLYRKRPDDTPLYPSHRTAEEKRLLRNKRARRARASMKGV